MCLAEISESVQTSAPTASSKSRSIISALKVRWTLLPMILLALDFYWVLWGNIIAIGFAVLFVAVLTVEAFTFKRSTVQTLKQYWPVVAVLAIISLSMYIRMFGFFSADGDTRWPYLRNIDSYFFYRHTTDTIDNGNVVPDLDTMKLAPYGGDRLPERLYLYISAYGFLVANVFGISFFSFMAIFPVLLASLVAIPMYFIGRLLYDRKAGVLASVFMVLSVSFMSRSLGGDPDSDAIVMMMAMVSIAAFLFMYKGIDKDKIFGVKNMLLSIAFGVSVFLFAYTWGGYWFTFWIVGSFIVLKVVADFLFHRKHKEEHMRSVWKHTKSLIVMSLLAVLVFELLVVPVLGVQAATTFVAAPFGAVFGGEYKGEVGQFPNVGVSIAEVQSGGEAKQVAVSAAGLDTAAGVSGMPMSLLTIVSPFLLTLACFLYFAYSYYKRHEHLDTLLFTGVWFFGFLFASVIAVRFTIFLAPVYAICSAILIAKFWRVASGEDRSLGA
jgi:asparagine N-glycosylation enzyme membrane subunit Stt3